MPVRKQTNQYVSRGTEYLFLREALDSHSQEVIVVAQLPFILTLQFPLRLPWPRRPEEMVGISEIVIRQRCLPSSA